MAHFSIGSWALFLCVAAVVPVAAHAQEVPAQDIAGSHDSAIVSRFPDSVIIGYHAVDFDQVTFPLGAYDEPKQAFTHTESVAGKVTDIAYAAPKGKSAFEVFQNYSTALQDAGFQTRFQCHNNACGDEYYYFTQKVLANRFVDTLAGYADAVYGNGIIHMLTCIQGQLYVDVAHLARAQHGVDLMLMVCGNPNYNVGVLLRTVDAKPMATGEITVNAQTMRQGLAQNGHIALYGIHFATDSAALTPASNATLMQMVALLQAQPTLKVYIVGHTDDTGMLAHNLTLSQQRAASVVKALEAQGITAPRLAAKGLASYAPVASNATNAGRAQNRRVELVKQ